MRYARVALAVVSLLLLVACGDDNGPSCEERGGRTVKDDPIIINQPPMRVGDSYIAQPPITVRRSHCEMPR